MAENEKGKPEEQKPRPDRMERTGPEPTAPSSKEPLPPQEEGVSTEEASSQALSEALASSFKIIRLVMVGLVILFIFSGSFIVQPNEVVILLRFGKPVGKGAAVLKKPGWHWAFPAPIDEKVRIRIGESKTVTSTTGWYATTPEMEAAGQTPPPKGYLSPDADGYVITADGNIMHVRARVKYRVTDPLQYYFQFADPEALLTNIVNEAIHYAASQVTAEEAIYSNKERYRELVLKRVQESVDRIQLGITLEPSDVETCPPVDVRPAFDEVIAAEQERSRLISDARGYMEETLRRAQGEADAILNEAMARSNQWVQTVRSLAESFNKMLPQYERDPQLFETRLLASKFEQIFTNVDEIFYLPDVPPGVKRKLWLLLNRQPRVPKAQQQGQQQQSQ